ncbi:leukotriene B4 receptor 1-like [Osmerus eperlanus]|uniref:leukotriene B4 receptor 1-like n=1 Tax=Osmerus eperlanus TaxID=29151 RepID=UPI002E0D4E8C
MDVSAGNTSTSSPNASSPSVTPLTSSLSFSLLLIAMVTGLPGNLLVVLSGAFRPRGGPRRRRRRSISALLVLQLASADFLVLLTTPFFLRQVWRGGAWEFGEGACKLLHYASAVNMYVSVYLVALMGLDRHLGVARPFLSQRLRTRSRLYAALAAVWVLALTMPVSLLVYRRVQHGMCFLSYPTPGHRVFQCSLELSAAFLLPFGLMTLCYLRVVRKLASHSRRHRRSYGRTNRLIGLVVGTFALLWTPYHLSNALQVGALWSGSSPGLLRFCLRSRPVVISLGYLSSAVNPVLYALAGPAPPGGPPRPPGGRGPPASWMPLLRRPPPLEGPSASKA